MSDDHLLVEIKDNVLWLTINRPEKRNALSLALLDKIGHTLAAHATEPELKCAVITAAGDRCFAAGGDLRELDAMRSPEQAEAMSKRGRHCLDQVRQFPLPVIAGLNGLALGGGAELALACDFRVAARNAEIGFLQSQLNVTTAWGGGIDLFAAVGNYRALELLLVAKRLSAMEAMELGLVNRLCGPEQRLDDCLQEFLAPYLRRGNQVLRGFKSLSVAHRAAFHQRLADVEQETFVTAWTHDDHWNAVEQSISGKNNPGKKQE